MIDGQVKLDEDITKDAQQSVAPHSWRIINFITIDPDKVRNKRWVEAIQGRNSAREALYHPPTSSQGSTISFNMICDTWRTNPGDEALMVTLHLSDYLVKRIMVDKGSSSNLLFLSAFKEMELLDQFAYNITTFIGFNEEATRSMVKTSLPVYADRITK